MPDAQLTFTPHNRLTRLAAVARDAIKASPEYREETDKLLISLDDGNEAAFYADGHDDSRSVANVLVQHLIALTDTAPDMH
jgi:hypothetical protein